MYEDISQLFNKIKANISEIEFISIVCTSWHLDNLTIFLKEKSSQRGRIIVFPKSNITNI